MGPNREDNRETLASAFSRTVGKERKRRVWPVGAVSKMMTLYSIESTYFMTSAKFIASSTPGMEKARSCIIPDMGLFVSSNKSQSPQQHDKKQMHLNVWG